MNNMQKHCGESMQKMHRDYKNEEQRRDRVVVLLRVIQA
jgi:hypothetical protein